MSLQVAFGIVALCMLVLFYFVTFRSTRSPYCGWWCAALLLFLLGSAAYLLDGTSQQVWANPLGSTLLVTGVSAVWAGSRSLRARRFRPRMFVLAPLCTAVAAAFDHPATNVWAGGFVYLASVSTMMGLASRELWLVKPTALELLRRGSTYSPALRSMAFMAGGLSLFYACRLVALLAVGQDGRVFKVYLGSEVTTLITTVLLTAVSFSMTSLSHRRETEELRARATHDGLTGLLNRTEFMRRAAAEWQDAHRSAVGGSLILADLDHFKRINDTYGHPVGDYVLQVFAASCRGIVRSTDLVGRYGGEEFIIFLPDVHAARAAQVAAEISERLRATPTPNNLRLPTVSYGIAAATAGLPLADAIERADRALYEAKTGGRDRVAHSR